MYEAIEVHFHWGSPLCKGSEHQINQRRYDLEMHIVHLNTKYGSVEEAREYDDGIAVIGAFFKVEKVCAMKDFRDPRFYFLINYRRHYPLSILG